MLQLDILKDANVRRLPKLLQSTSCYVWCKKYGAWKTISEWCIPEIPALVGWGGGGGGDCRFQVLQNQFFFFYEKIEIH